MHIQWLVLLKPKNTNEDVNWVEDLKTENIKQVRDEQLCVGYAVDVDQDDVD